MKFPSAERVSNPLSESFSGRNLVSNVGALLQIDPVNVAELEPVTHAVKLASGLAVSNKI
jgi:hypothetical protein